MDITFNIFPSLRVFAFQTVCSISYGWCVCFYEVQKTDICSANKESAVKPSAAVIIYLATRALKFILVSDVPIRRVGNLEWIGFNSRLRPPGESGFSVGAARSAS